MGEGLNPSPTEEDETIVLLVRMTFFRHFLKSREHRLYMFKRGMSKGCQIDVDEKKRAKEEEQKHVHRIYDL